MLSAGVVCDSPSRLASKPKRIEAGKCKIQASYPKGGNRQAHPGLLLELSLPSSARQPLLSQEILSALDDAPGCEMRIRQSLALLGSPLVLVQVQVGSLPLRCTVECE